MITATRGNHGGSIAYAAKQFGVHATIVVPYGNNPEKNRRDACFRCGVNRAWRRFDESRELCEKLQTERGLRYVHPANEPPLFHGVGTYSLEIFEELPEVDTIIVPIGAGSGACGTITVAQAINPNVKVIGVQAANAPSFTVRGRQGRRSRQTQRIRLLMGWQLASHSICHFRFFKMGLVRFY